MISSTMDVFLVTTDKEIIVLSILFYFFLSFLRSIVPFLVTTDKGSSPKRLGIQALGYILNLTKFMYLLVLPCLLLSAAFQ